MLGGGPLAIGLTTVLDGHLEVALAGSYTETDAEGWQYGYGGPMVSWYFRPGRRIDPSVGLLVGGGGGSNPATGEEGGALVLEPQAAVDLWLLESTKLSLGVSYRWAALGSAPDLAVFSGPSVFFALKEGRFAPSPYAPRTGPGLTGSWSGKWLWLDGRVFFLDGGGTRVRLGDRWLLVPYGYRMHRGTDWDSVEISTMDFGLWVECVLNPAGVLQAALGAHAGLFFVGTFDETQPEPRTAVSPMLEPTVTLALMATDFLRLCVSAGYRVAPFVPVLPSAPGLTGYGPALSLFATFGAF